MKTNCNSAYLMKSIQVVSLILLISLAITGVVSGNVTFSISGAVHNDVNGNGEYDPGDRGIPDVYIRLLDSKNKTIADTDTDLNGNYFFLGLAEGNYYLEKTSGKGWEQISPKSSKAIEVKLNSTDARGNPGRDFLDRRIPIDKGIVDHIVDFLTDFKKTASYLWPGIVWFLVFIFMCLLAFFTVRKLHSVVGKKKESTNNDDCSCNYLLLFVLIGTTFLGWTFYIFGKPFYIIPLIGIACLAIPLILSISADYNIGSKLDNGEIRKSIVISLTVVYIIFLAISFEKSIDEMEMNSKIYDANFTMKLDKLINNEIRNNPNISQTMIINAKINSNSEGFATPERLTADFSSNKTEVVLASKENSSKDSGRNVPLPSSSANATNEQMIPEEVMATFTKNFLYVYILIILFYFGSRFIDEYRTSSNLEKWIAGEKKEDDIGKIVSARFAIGDIGAREYKETIDALGYRADKTIEVTKYALSVAIADVGKKYDVWKKAEVREKAALAKFEEITANKEGQKTTAEEIENARTEKNEAANKLQTARADFDTAIAKVEKIKKELMNAENKKSDVVNTQQ